MSAVDFDVLPRLEARLRKLEEEFPAKVAEAVRLVLSERDGDAVGGLTQLAQWMGRPSADAARKALERDSELRSLAIPTPGGIRKWRKSEVLALMSSRRAGR